MTDNNRGGDTISSDAMSGDTNSGDTITVQLPPERVAGLRSGQRGEVRAAIKGLSRKELAAWLQTPDGEEVLRDAFRRMPQYYVADPSLDETLVRWRVKRAAHASVDYDLMIGPLGCVVADADAAAKPRVTLTVDSVGFVEMASAARRGVDLLLHGRLHVQGDVRLAMRMEKLFGFDADAEH